MIERVTVISGTMNMGMGDKLDTAQGKAFPAGTFVFIPGKMNHFAWADEETIIQINGDGPFDINYINPADDPRNFDYSQPEMFCNFGYSQHSNHLIFLGISILIV